MKIFKYTQYTHTRTKSAKVKT